MGLFLFSDGSVVPPSSNLTSVSFPGHFLAMSCNPEWIQKSFFFFFSCNQDILDQNKLAQVIFIKRTHICFIPLISHFLLLPPFKELFYIFSDQLQVHGFLLLLFISQKSVHSSLIQYFLICSPSTYRNILHTKLETHLFTHSANYPSSRTLMPLLFYYTKKTDALRKEIAHIPSQ